MASVGRPLRLSAGAGPTPVGCSPPGAPWGRAPSRPSDQLHMIQSRLSQAIRHLQSRHGATLFDRTNRRVELTAADEALLADARRILDQSWPRGPVRRRWGQTNAACSVWGRPGSLPSATFPGWRASPSGRRRAGCSGTSRP
ncbi:helix-turn-helix domain-containing protein [Geodermatophilus normandii]|uniref:LysR family transcriptional regulator n=1 Tax=Geodermatophilus normandii TaxID=1137989 RepID=A0A6P0GP54_9ACTN|nr:LysR family transcriptional regulator [Geodermatophilus normandii]